MTRVHLPNISDNKTVVTCASMNISEINVKLIPLEGYPFNYILSDGNDIVYIGYSSRLYDRLFFHKHSKEFDMIHLIEFTDKKAALSMERDLIKHYRPKYNKQYLQ